MIKIYGVRASRAFRPLWLLEELGVPYEHVPTNLTGDTRSAEFLKLNPNGHIPVMVDGTLVLWESMAINLYLGRKYGAGSLWPADVGDEGRTFQWSFWAMTEAETSLLTLLLHRRLLPADQRKESAAAEAEAKVVAPFGVLDGALRHRPYLLGESFGVADLNVAAVLQWALTAKLDLTRWPHLTDWLGRCIGRPAVKRARG